MTYRRKSDGNQQVLMDYARSIGMSVDDIHREPKVLDLLVGYMGVDQRVEVKQPGEKLNANEADIFENWRGRPPVIWETTADVERTRTAMMSTAMKLKGTEPARR